jgi:hypothetical protein
VKAIPLFAALALTGCAAVPVSTPSIAHPLAEATSSGWLAHRPADEVTIDTRALRAARDTELLGASLNKKGKPRTALWVGVAIAGAIHLHNMYELTEDIVECVLELSCGED